MKFIDKVLQSKRKIIYVGLRSATTREISEYKQQLHERGLKFMHLTKNLPYNGILRIEK